MKRWMGVAAIVLLTTVASAADSAATFARLQKLAGTWEVKTPDGKTSEVEVKSISAGSALMIMQPDEGHGSMVTMIHQDGDRVLLTHYCSAQNQPRMVAEAMPDGKTIKFNFLDATNVAKGQPGVMRGVVLTLPDDDHMSQQWIFRDADGKEVSETFAMVRKK